MKLDENKESINRSFFAMTDSTIHFLRSLDLPIAQELVLLFQSLEASVAVLR